MTAPCPYCRREVEARRAMVNLHHYTVPGIQVGRGPEHAPRCRLYEATPGAGEEPGR